LLFMSNSMRAVPFQSSNIRDDVERVERFARYVAPHCLTSRAVVRGTAREAQFPHCLGSRSRYFADAGLRRITIEADVWKTARAVSSTNRGRDHGKHERGE
jgi:hypothetical protein